MNLMRGIDLKKIAEKMNGASGAELKVFFFICILCFLPHLLNVLVEAICDGVTDLISKNY